MHLLGLHRLSVALLKSFFELEMVALEKSLGLVQALQLFLALPPFFPTR